MQPSLVISGREIGSHCPAFLIAEAGVNHNGDLSVAKRMIDACVAAGTDAVKFQTFHVPDLILEDVPKAPYQKMTMSEDEDQYEMLEGLQIDRNFHIELMDYCAQKGLIFLSTPYDDRSLDLLLALNVPAIKIASTDTTNVLFLEKAATAGKPLILSTGMSNLFEIEQAYRTVKAGSCEQLAILKCTSSYPTDLADVNLSALAAMKVMFPDAVTGFSDHTEGVGASPYAVAMGARIVEKHFTLDKSLPGPDHKASLDASELKAWVKEIRRVEIMIGKPSFAPTAKEWQSKRALQKSLVARRAIDTDREISRHDLTAKRTGGVGIPASMALDVLGKKVTQKVEKDAILYWSLFEG